MLSALLCVNAQAEVYSIEGIGVSGALSAPGDKFDTAQKIAKTKRDPFAPTVSGEATMGSITKKEIEEFAVSHQEEKLFLENLINCWEEKIS